MVAAAAVVCIITIITILSQYWHRLAAESEYTFRRQLKTWLFKKSFPDIII